MGGEREEEEIDMEAKERSKWKCEYEEGKSEDKGIVASRMMEYKWKSKEKEVGKEGSGKEVGRNTNRRGTERS